MKKMNSFVFFVLVFIIAQLAWLGLLGLWIYWYVSNNIIFEQVGDQLSPQINIYSSNVWVFVGGIILIVALAFFMSVMFRNLSLQLRLTKLYDNFIGNITHELKSPLASIRLYLETLRTRDVPRDKQNEFIDSMMKNADRLNHLINSILEISSLEQKKISHDFQLYSSKQIIDNILNDVIERFKFPPKNIKITNNTNCSVIADGKALKIVFDNLIENAVKYSNGKPEIKIDLSCKAGKLIINIQDNGIGIPVDEQKKIFKKFYRVYGKDIPNVKGTGLGLYWVKEILKHHKGKISVDSAGSDKGSSFKIELPVRKNHKVVNGQKSSEINGINNE